MTKTHTTRKALLMSILSLMLCFSMLIGTTFAWFTDTVTSAGNVIKTGKLDVELHWAEGTEDPNTNANWIDASTGAIFDYDNWEPGYVQVRHIRIANKGTLAFKYKVSIIANGEVSDLAKVIDVYYVDPAIQVTDRADLNSVPKLGTLDQVLAKLGETGNGTLEKGDSDVITIAFKMQETAGNEYQEKSIGSDFSVQLLATQLAFEGDSFDKEYDVEATYLNKDADGAWLINNMDELFYFSNDVNSGNAYSGETVKLTADIDLAGYNWIPIGAGDVNGQWIGFNGIFDGQGHTIFNMKITKGGGWNGLFGLVGRGTSTFTESISNVNLKNVVIENANRMTGGVVGQMYGNIENCHVDNVTITAVPNWIGTEYDNGDKVGGIVGWLGDNGNYHYAKSCSATNVTLKAYRDVGGITGYIGSSTIVENCAVDTVNITVDQITNHYGNKDANAGGVVGRIYSTPVTIQNNTEANVTITVPKMVSTVAQLTAALDGDETVTLAADIVLPDDWTPAGNGTRDGSSYTGDAFEGVLDGNGHTISNVKTSLIGVLTGTVKNVKIVADVDSTSDSVGAVAGVLVGGTVSDVTVSGSVTAPKAVGGLVGRVLASGTIKNCTNNATVTSTGGSDAAGGIVGKAYYTANGEEMNIENCTNNGTVSGKYAAGGIAGFSAANVIGCTNSGNVVLTEGTAKSVGGIIGEQTNYGEIKNNTNTADIITADGTSNAGGIIGWMRYQNSAASYPANEIMVVSGNVNEGTVAGTYTAGGIVGLAYNQAIVTDNTNKAASVSAGVFAGGIVGGLQVDNNNLTISASVRFVVTDNTTTTALANITANCADVVAYNNGPHDPTFADISNNTIPQ